jgi:hypothetical protein
MDGKASSWLMGMCTRKRAGAAVAQLHIEFERVVLNPGETKHLHSISVPRSVSYFDVKSSTWKADAGTYSLMLGDSFQNLYETISIQLTKPLSVTD